MKSHKEVAMETPINQRMLEHTVGIPISNEHFVHVPCDDYLDYCHEVRKLVLIQARINESYMLAQPCIQQLQDSIRKGDLEVNDYIQSMVDQIEKAVRGLLPLEL